MHAPQDPPSPDRQGGRRSRRAFLQLSASLTGGLLVAACIARPPRLVPARDATRAADTTSPIREEIQIVYQDWRTDWFPELVETTLTEFHDHHPDIRVFFTPDPDNLADAMLADMQAGTAPDVFWGGSTFFTMWAQQGHLLDLRPYVAADLDEATLSEWDPAQYRAFFLHNGAQFGLPKYHGVVALYYNKALFDAAGIAYPTADWSYDDYLTAMQTLSHSDAEGVRDQWGSMVDITWDHLQIYANAWGGHFVAPYDPAYCTIAAPAAKAALSWLRARIWDDHVMASFPDVQYMSPRSAFINGRVAMMEEGSWVLKDVLTSSDFPVGVAPLPQGPARRVALAAADGFGIFNETQYPEAAWTLLQFLTSTTYGRALAQADFLQPARASLIDEWIGLIHSAFPTKTADLDLSAFVDSHRQGRSVAIEVAERMADIEPKLMGTFEQIFTLGQAPVSTLTTVCTEINQLLQSGNHQNPHLAE